jgi:hypothetical protein
MLSLTLVCLGLLAADDGAAKSARGSPDRAAYEAVKGRTGRDAQAHVRLALWCEQHGLGSERMKHLVMAALYDPSNVLARGLMGLVAYQGKWERPEQISRQVQDDLKRKALMQEYLRRRAQTSDRADDQWKLALWCEQNGLKDQAIAQYHAVLRRDPSRDAAWKRLGFKKVGGRWIKPEWQAAQKQESEQQNRANKHWKPLLEKWCDALFGHSKVRRAEAEAGLAQISDARAVPAIWAVFVPKGAAGQKVAVHLLSQVDSPGASWALALLALVSESREARQEAVQVLRHRDPRDFAPLLVGLIHDPIKYEVKPVNGPGSQGQLVIKSKDINVKRLYSPLGPPNVPLLASDFVTVDAAGLSIIIRGLGLYSTPLAPVRSNATPASTLGIPTISANQATSFLTQAGLPSNQARALGPIIAQRVNPPVQDLGGPANTQLRARAIYAESLEIPVGQMILDSQRSAQVAQQQLAGDVQAIDAYNAPIQRTNRLARQVLAETVGTDLGEDSSAWQKWMVDLFGYAYVAPSSSPYEPSTIVEQVPIDYQPQAAPPMIFPQVVGIQTVRFHSCFAAGTLVQTIDGPRPIEDLLAGDDVLTQDPRTGELKYQPLVAVYHNPPNATFRVELQGTDESIVATGIHRLWKAGKGWIMVRDLKPGDVLRTLGGTAAVELVQEERVQPVFNLRVAEGESFFVGRCGILAHDNSTINPTPEPFDAVEPLPVPGTKTAAKRSVLGR